MADECQKLNQRQLRALGCRCDAKKKKYRPPSDTTFFRVINRVDPVGGDDAALYPGDGLQQRSAGRDLTALFRDGRLRHGQAQLLEQDKLAPWPRHHARRAGLS